MRPLLTTLRFGLIFLFGVFGLSANVQAGTIAFWSGNGNANDSVGSHNGTLENGAGFAAGQFGQQAFSLNSSSSQYISVPDSTAWDFASNPFSIAMLVNFTSISGGALGSGANALMGHDEGGGATNKWFFSYMSDGTLGFHINSTSGTGVFLTSPSASPVSAGVWNLFTVTRSGSTYTFYENATSLGTVGDSTAIPAIAAPLTIGQTGEAIGFVNGRLQNVQIFDNALSASEVAALVPEPSTSAGWVIALGSLGMYRLHRRQSRFAQATTSVKTGS